MRGTPALLLATLALTGAAPGCSPGGHVVCTDIGCESGIGAELQGAALDEVTGPFLVRICADEVCTESPAHSERADSVYVFQELPGAEAGQQVSVRVELEQDGVVLLRHEREVRLREERPNGRRCPPVCNQRHLVIDQP